MGAMTRTWTLKMRSNQLNFKQQLAEQLFAKATTEPLVEPTAQQHVSEVDPAADEQGSNKYRTIWKRRF